MNKIFVPHLKSASTLRSYALKNNNYIDVCNIVSIKFITNILMLHLVNIYSIYYRSKRFESTETDTNLLVPHDVRNFLPVGQSEISILLQI